MSYSTGVKIMEKADDLAPTYFHFTIEFLIHICL